MLTWINSNRSSMRGGKGREIRREENPTPYFIARGCAAGPGGAK